MPSFARRPRLRALLGGTVFGLCAAYVAATFTWSEIATVLGRADLGLLLVAGYGSILLVWLARTARWQALLRSLGIRVRFRDLYLCNAIALGLATVTPAQSGELLKLRLVKRYASVDLTRGLATFGAERVADLLVLAALALGALALQGSSRDLPALGAVLATIVAATLLGWAIGRSGRLPRRLRPFAVALGDSAGTTAAKVTLLALTVVGWCATAFGWQACLASVGIDLTFVQAVGLVCLVTVANVLSLVPGGLGVSEVGVTAFLLGLDVPLSQAQAGALVIRVYGLMFLALSLLHLAAAQARRGGRVP